MTTIARTVTNGLNLRKLAFWLNTNRVLTAGIILATMLLFIGYALPLFIDQDNARLGAAQARQSPTLEHVFGTDTQGRDVWTVWVLGMGQTLKVGFIAAAAGVGIGMALGLSSGYFGGVWDSVIRTINDVAITIPAIAILILVAASVQNITVEIMALIVALFTWTQPTRTIRAQVLTLRERSYIHIAKLNGLEGVELVVKEILPNLLPFVATQFVWAFSVAVLATIGLEALGLGPDNEHTLGMMVYWVRFYSGVLRNLWWWWVPPIAAIGLIFITLYMLSIGLDKYANPRIQRD